jgi:hypothetical protein
MFPTIGPVQETETTANANAMKIIPTSTFIPALESILVMELGNIISVL